MDARPLSLRWALTLTVVACLALQLVATLVFFPAALPAAVAIALLAGGAAVLLLRWAFGGLSAAAERLSQMAQAEDWQRSLRAPAMVAPRAHAELEALRQRVLERVERSQKLRAQAEEAANYKGAFLRSVRHELRTPLNSILGFSDVLLSDLEGPLSAEQHENLRVIRAEGQRLSDMFDEVIALATVISGQLELQRSSVDLDELLSHIAAAHDAALAARPLHLRREVTPPGLRVTADAGQLEQVLSSLLAYALRVTPGNALRLSALAGDDEVAIELVDRARRLSPDELSQLLHGTTSGRRRAGLDEGARLRLSICRQIVELHGGRFAVDSDEQHGTRFSLRLPKGDDG